MPGFLLHVGATVLCSHARAGAADGRRIRACWSAGSRRSTIAAPYVVAGCAFPPPPGGNGPCVTAQFVTVARRA